MLALGLTVLLLGGCSFLKLGYRYLDWVLYFSVQKQFDLTWKQKGDLRKRVNAYADWHKAEMLPMYTAFLREVSQRIPAGLNEKDLDWGFARYQELRLLTMKPLVKASTEFLLELDSRQWENYARKAADKNTTLRQKWNENPESFRDKRAKQTVEQVEEFTGKLRPDQRRAVDSLSRALPLNTLHWLEFRGKQQEALSRVAGGGDSTAVIDFLENYFLSPETLRTRSHQEAVTAQERRSKEMLLAISAILTPEQRLAAARQLSAFSADLEKLSR